MSSNNDVIAIRGARTHNLAGVDVDIPRQRLVVVTGPSGCGKSSLIFDTLYAEAQRRFVESLSVGARQFLQQMDRAEVEHISGLSPAIALSQQSHAGGARSTVATMTDIYDYLRLLYARAGVPHCPEHGVALSALPVAHIVERLSQLPEQPRIALLAPLDVAQSGGYAQTLEQMRRQGYVRIRLDGTLLDLDAAPVRPPREPQLDVVIDRLRARPEAAGRLAESVEAAVALGDGVLRVLWLDTPEREPLLFSTRHSCPYCGFACESLTPRLFSFNTPEGACSACEGLGRQPDGSCCEQCQGQRLNATARHVRLAGMNIAEVCALDVRRAKAMLAQWNLEGEQGQIAQPLLQAIDQRLNVLLELGLGYLGLDRCADTLSGGEIQRIRLATQLGTGLTGVLYVLDEPSIGLHPRDSARLLRSLQQLRDLGNSVLVVEHDLALIRAADWVVEMGPGAGCHGGRVLVEGPPAMLAKCPASVTAPWLAAQPLSAMNTQQPEGPWLHIRGASGHNLRHIDVAFPVGRLSCVSGVSGSGKSTLISATLAPVAAARLNGSRHGDVAAHTSIEGLEHFERLIAIDQHLGRRNARSMPATYCGLMTPLRELFAATPEARARGYTAARFSLNASGGRCERCRGEGVRRVEMQFLPDVLVCCEVCGGRRYNAETLQVHYRGYAIDQVLDMTVERAAALFAPIPALQRRLAALQDVGLGYLQLGQNATTLSGGEWQRLILARELARRSNGQTLYVLDEPTTGLHASDVARLLAILQRLCAQGNTVVVIEHDPMLIAAADWVIDLGPEGGEAGGQLLYAGPPAGLIRCRKSVTGAYLASEFDLDWATSEEGGVG